MQIIKYFAWFTLIWLSVIIKLGFWNKLKISLPMPSIRRFWFYFRLKDLGLNIKAQMGKLSVGNVLKM